MGRGGYYNSRWSRILQGRWGGKLRGVVEEEVPPSIWPSGMIVVQNEGAIPIKVYCEHSAMSRDIRAIQRGGDIKLVHFPYDPDSRSRHIGDLAMPSNAQIRDLNLQIMDLPGTVAEYSGSVHFATILYVLGLNNWRDALHVDSAFKSGCAAFVTVDSDILNQKSCLEKLLGVKFFHPVNDLKAFRLFVSDIAGAT